MNLEDEFTIKAGQLLAIQENASLIMAQLIKVYGCADPERISGVNVLLTFQLICEELRKQSPVILQALKSINATLGEVMEANQENKT